MQELMHDLACGQQIVAASSDQFLEPQIPLECINDLAFQDHLGQLLKLLACSGATHGPVGRFLEISHDYYVI